MTPTGLLMLNMTTMMTLLLSDVKQHHAC